MYLIIGPKSTNTSLLLATNVAFIKPHDKKWERAVKKEEEEEEERQRDTASFEIVPAI